MIRAQSDAINAAEALAQAYQWRVRCEGNYRDGFLLCCRARGKEVWLQGLSAEEIDAARAILKD